MAFRKRERRAEFNFILLALVVSLGGMLCPRAEALETSFHGYLETNLIVRDQNGFQYGFMNEISLKYSLGELMLRSLRGR